MPSNFRIWVAAGCIALTGCRTGREHGHWQERRTPRLSETLELKNGTFELRSDEVDRAAFDRVAESIERAAEALERWGDFREPVRVTVVASSRKLDQLVNEGRFPGRRGFARYDQVFLLSPDAWSARGAREAELEELVLHELTHALMYQHSARRTGWRRKGIPFWFREGMASYTARQAYRWDEPSRAALHDELQDELSDEQGSRPDRFSGTVKERYGAAHYAFDALLSRGGERRVRELLEEMEEGSAFDEAFEEIYREPVPQFLAQLERDLPPTEDRQ
jgi:hypothetical protein